jgi:transcriptional regulator with XRE-family HTH domain
MMEAKEALAARQALGLSQDAVAAELNLTPGVVAAWESGEIRVPKRIEEQLRWRVALTERITALTHSGLPECEWRKNWESRGAPSSLKAITKYYEESAAHRKTCQVCAAREKYVLDRFGKMPPPPMEGWMKTFGLIADPIERLPRWAQPAGWVAVGFGLYSLLRIIVMLPAIARNPSYWPVALGGLALSMSIGAGLGLIYGGFREFRERRVARRAT